MNRFSFSFLITSLMVCGEVSAGYFSSDLSLAPSCWQASESNRQLESADADCRASAMEKLGFMRDWNQAESIAKYLNDSNAVVRREAVMALGWVGNESTIPALKKAISDDDWTVRQAAAVALENLTAIPFKFDALAEADLREKSLADWSARFESANICEEALAALTDSGEDFFVRSDKVRAAGTFGCDSLVQPIIETLRPYLTKDYPADTIGKGKKSKESGRLYTPASPAVDARPERAFVQSCIRSLGRMGGPDAETFLIEILQTNIDWANYAAEALGDCGGEKAVSALLAEIPQTAFKLDVPAHFAPYDGVVKRFADHDAPGSGLSGIDRIPRLYYDVLASLCKLDLSNHKAELRAITPYLLSTTPSQWDATVIYTQEPWMMMYAYLFEQAGVREELVDASLTALGVKGRELPDSFDLKAQFMKQAERNLKSLSANNPPFAGTFLIFSAKESDLPDLLPLLKHESGWVKIDLARALMSIGSQDAVDSLIAELKAAKDDMDYGFDMDFSRFRSNRMVGQKKKPGAGYDEISDPSPRHKEAFLRALGSLKAERAVPVLIDYLNNDRNAIEIQVAAGLALAEIASPAALDALKEAELNHPVAVVQINARDALWQNNVKATFKMPDEKIDFIEQLPIPEGLPKEIVFLKGDREPGNNEQITKDMTSYSTTDAGPTYRLGRNIFRLKTDDPENSLKQLTHFKTGYVTDIEVSYDGKKILFAHNTLDPEPWYHIYEMNADGSNLTQLTFGPYHDVHPNYMPDGRIVFTSSRSGIRDEYHGFPANALSVMNSDGSDIHVIGFNIGRDAEPVVAEDGKILFTRLELFYSRMKTEWNLLSVFPDGRRTQTLYGPERRWTLSNLGGADAVSPPRHRSICISQPQHLGGAEYLVNTFAGPMIAGPGRYKDEFLWKDREWAVTSPYKIDDETLMVSAGKRSLVKEVDKKKPWIKVGSIDQFGSVDHGIYWMDVETSKLTPIYNDPNMADFEARPLQPRKVPPILPDGAMTRSRSYSGTMYCSSAFITQDPHVKERGKYIRVIEGIPTIARHQTHTNGGTAWRNHGGAVSRVFGTLPLAADGSFYVELPSDRLFHFQVLDGDRKVMGNELIWQYVRPQEAKGCVGCHENPDESPSVSAFPLAQKMKPVQCFPNGDEMLYHAKMWHKGWAPDEREERMRTVNSINVIGRN